MHQNTTPSHERDTSASVVSEVLDEFGQVVQHTESTIEERIAPVRQGILKRFPTLFLLIVTFGVTATFFGIEQILIQFDLLQRYPWLILASGIGALVLTGTLYKKLG